MIEIKSKDWWDTWNKEIYKCYRMNNEKIKLANKIKKIETLIALHRL